MNQEIINNFYEECLRNEKVKEISKSPAKRNKGQPKNNPKRRNNRAGKVERVKVRK